MPRGLHLPQCAVQRRARFLSESLTTGGASDPEFDGGASLEGHAFFEPPVGCERPELPDLLTKPRAVGLIREHLDSFRVRANSGGQSEVVATPGRGSVIGDVIEARRCCALRDHGIDARHEVVDVDQIADPCTVCDEEGRAAGEVYGGAEYPPRARAPPKAGAQHGDRDPAAVHPGAAGALPGRLLPPG